MPRTTTEMSCKKVHWTSISTVFPNCPVKEQKFFCIIHRKICRRNHTDEVTMRHWNQPNNIILFNFAVILWTRPWLKQTTSDTYLKETVVEPVVVDAIVEVSAVYSPPLESGRNCRRQAFPHAQVTRVAVVNTRTSSVTIVFIICSNHTLSTPTPIVWRQYLLILNCYTETSQLQSRLSGKFNFCINVSLLQVSQF